MLLLKFVIIGVSITTAHCGNEIVQNESMKSVQLTARINTDEMSVIITGNDRYVPASQGEDTSKRSAGQNALLGNKGTKKFILSYEEICAQLKVGSIPENLQLLPNCTFSSSNELSNNARAQFEFNAYLLPLKEAPHDKYPVVTFQSTSWFLVFRLPWHTLSWTMFEGSLRYTDPHCSSETQTMYVPWGPFLVVDVIQTVEMD